MEFQQLRYFQTVARLQHMTQAAEQLNITQPALSRTISRLEDDLGVPLFERTGRQIKLNEYGKIFLHHLEQSFVVLDQAQKKINDLAQLNHNSLTVGTTNVSLFFTIAAAFLQQHPEIRIHQYLRSSSEMYDALDVGEFDLCISTEPIEGEDVEWIPFFTEEVFLLVPREPRFLNLSTIPLIEMKNEKFISMTSAYESVNLVRRLCLGAGFTPMISFEGSDSLMIAEMVIAGLGVSFIPKQLWQRHAELFQHRLHVLQITEPQCTITVGMLKINNRYLSQAGRKFYSYVVNNQWLTT